MKLEKGLKIALIILIIILISIVSFGGIYIQEKKSMENILKDYKLGMDLKGNRTATISVSEETKTVYYDKEGNIVSEEKKDGTKKEVPINSEEILTKENYKKTKQIIEKRLKEYGAPEYIIRQDENTGKMTVQLEENENTDIVLQYIHTVGKFEIVGEDNQVLLNNENIKKASAVYGTTEKGTNVYINIEFNKDCIDKLKEISNTYVKSTDEEGNDTTKKISINLDDVTLTSTSFGEEISNGILQISVGEATNDNTTINNYLKEARNLAVLLNNGKLPIEYTINQNRYIQSDITMQNLKIAGITVIAITIIVAIILGIMYKKDGIFIGLTSIGYLALLLLLVRYTNVIFTIEGLFGILMSITLNYIFGIYLLKMLKKVKDVKKSYNKTVINMLWILIPAIVIGITFCFVNWMPVYSFGATLFWGILAMIVYNTVLTRTLLVCGAKK